MKIRKYFKFIVPTISFYVVLEIFFRSFGLSFNSVLLIFGISAFGAFWASRYKFLPILAAVLLASGIVLFFVTIGDNNFKYAFMIASTLMYFFLLVGIEKFFARQEEYAGKSEKRIKIIDSGFNLNQTIVIISLFLLISGFYGIYLSLSIVPTWVVILVVFSSVFVSTTYLTKINFMKSVEMELHLDSAKNKTFTFYSLLFSFLSAQLVWSMSFWPVNQLTIGSIMLISFYTAWNVLKKYLRNELTKNFAVFNLVFFFAACFIIMYTSKWSILSTI